MQRSIRQACAVALLTLLMAVMPSARPALAAAFTVTTTADGSDATPGNGICATSGGLCTLRAAIQETNALAGSDTISFNIPTSDSGYNSSLGVWTIRPVTLALTAISDASGGTTIDARTQPGGRASGPKIEIDGSLAVPSGIAGFQMTTSNNAIYGFVINRFDGGAALFSGYGVFINSDTATNNTISQNWIGLNAAGTSVAPNVDTGIHIYRGDSNIIRNNVVAGNGSAGKPNGAQITIGKIGTGTPEFSTSNIVAGNIIGLNPQGTAIPGGTLPDSDGILVGNYVTNNTIGGSLTADRNVIGGISTITTGVGRNGVIIQGTSNSGTLVQGNYIGLNSAGTAAIPNAQGVTIRNDVDTAQITGNTIAGNLQNGVLVEAIVSTVTGVTISNNRIGLDASGNPRGNTLSGITLQRSGNNAVGVSSITISGNTISANSQDGITVGNTAQSGSLYTGITLSGNFIGTAPGGLSTTTSLLNGQSGVVFFSGQNNTVGGAALANRNVIAARTNQAALRLSGANVSGFTVSNNAIGIGADGNATLISDTAQRAAFGVLVESGSTGNTIGPDNVIGANGTGIQINGSTGNTIRTNRIGLDFAGTAARGNTQFGVWVLNAPTTTIGGIAVGDGNTIGSNGSHGIFADGTNGTLAISHNTVSGNAQVGILLNSSGSSGATLLDNAVATNGLDGIRLTAATGVQLSRNTTSSNTGSGIALLSSANANQAAPTLTATLATGGGGEPRLTGTASGCGGSGCIIEIFSSSTRQDGEGPRYITSGTADPGTGAFSIDVSGCDRYMTATARNPSNNNTSPFTTPMVDTTTGCSAGTPTLSAGSPATSAGAPRSVTPGTSVTYQHTLTNSGGLGATFTLAATPGTQGWSVIVRPTSIVLAPGAFTTVVVTVTVPLNAAGGAIENTTVTATAGALSDSKINYSRAPQTFGVNIEPPQSQIFGISASPVVITYTHTITNTGNGSDTITLNATNGTIAGSPSFAYPDTNQCTIAAGAACSRRVQVTLPANSTGGTFTVTATGGGAATDSVIDSAFSQSIIPSLTSVAQQNVFPGGTVQFVHTLTNIGTQSGTFTPTLTLPSPLDGWSYSFTPNTSFTLGAAATRTITVTAIAPAISSTGAISGTIKTATLQVVASSGAQATANDSARVLLQPQFSLSAASVTPVDAAPLVTVVFTHTLQNTSNGDDRYTVVMTPTAGLQNVTITPSSPISVARGASAQLIVRAQVRAGTIVGTQSVTIGAQTLSTPRPAGQGQIDTINVTGAAVPSLSVAPSTRSGAAGSALRFTYTLTNTGNQDGTFTPPSFSLPSAQIGWSTAIVGSPPACISAGDLTPGSSCTFDVDISSPANAFAGANPIRATVASVTTPSAPSASATSVVTINANPQLSFAPNRSGTANPSTVISYTHTLTNTGNITDTYTFSMQVPSGWTAPAPTTLLAVPPGAVRSVTVNVTPPAAILAGSSAIVTTTVTSGTAPNPTAQVADTTTIASIDAATLTPASQTNGGVAGQTSFFFPTLRNTGSTAIAFDIGVTTASWTSIVTPTTTAVLQPGATLPITLSVQVPLGTPLGVNNLSTLTITKSGSLAPLTTGAYTTTTSVVGSLLAPRTNSRTVLPNGTTIYTHTLTNITGRADTFTLRTVATNGWKTTVAPASVFLNAGASQVIEVRVTVPPARPAGEQDYGYVEVQALSDPTVSSLGTEITTVQRFAQSAISPAQVRSIEPGQVIEFQHTIINQGNQLDTFQISGENTLGWAMTVVVPSGAQITLLPGASFPVDVRVTVPAGIARGTTNSISVSATSAFDGTQSSVSHLVVYPTLPAVATTYRISLPVIRTP